MADLPRLIFVGGFLGSGKTTLILEASRMLQARDLRVALIMNDQDSELIDTQLARAVQFETQEVAGGCFCCRFSDLLDQAKALRSHSPDVIFAEPVGSCIDLSATILQPFQAFHRDLFEVTPLTVLLDPVLATQVMSDQAPPEVAYLFRQQAREADIVCVTKTDLYPDSVDLPFPVDFRISARTRSGVRDWIEEVVSGRRVPGARLLDVDYKEYAQAEAALGWLNLNAVIRLRQPASPAAVAGPFLEMLDQSLTDEHIRIAHLKVFDRTQGGYVAVSIRANHEEPEPRGDLIAEPAVEHRLALNLRALGDPAKLTAIVEDALSSIPGTVKIGHLRAFRPAPPVPEHRFSTTAQGMAAH